MKKRSNHRNETVDDNLTNFWGKKLSPKDLKICETLGWIENVVEDGHANWRLVRQAYQFAWPVHVDGKVRKYEVCDQALLSYISERTLGCLDPFFGCPTDRRLGLRTLLTLIDHVFNGMVEYFGLDHVTYFAATIDLCSWQSTSDKRSALVQAARAGNVVVSFDDDGLDVGYVTPKGLICGLTQKEIDQFGLAKILSELERRELLQKQQVGSEFRWDPTEKGCAVGLARDDLALVDILYGLGIKGLGKFKCFGGFLPATPL